MNAWFQERLKGAMVYRVITVIFTVILMLFLFLPSAQALESISDDTDLWDGKWTALAQRYPSPYISEEGLNAPDPELLAKWWIVFEDDLLTELIGDALQKNRNLQSARAKVMEARASLGISKAELLPWLDGVGSWTQTRNSTNAVGNEETNDVHRLGLDASWEIDIFGGKHAQIQAAKSTLEAEHALLHDVWVTLASEVALNYLSLRTLQERLNIAEKNLALQKDMLDLLRSQLDSGLTDSLALNQAQYTVEQTRATIPPIRISIEEMMNALAILVGQTPGALEMRLSEPKPLPNVDAVKLIGIPAEHLRRRPDIRAAERQLAAQLARKKVAEKDLLPRFRLIGSIGIESLSAGSLFSSDSYGFNFGPSITLPIFHGGAIRKNIKVQGARAEQLLAAYEQTVLNAAAEVRNALTANVQEIVRNDSLRLGIEAARNALEVADDKYRNGLTDFNNVIGAQQALLSFEDQYVVSEGQKVSNVVQVFKALGGGWAPLANWYATDVR